MQPQSSLGHLPDGAWTFDAEVTACFQDMLARSIPQLDVMRQLVFTLGCSFVHPGDHVLDLGCSLGDALAPFVSKYGASCTYTGVEVSAPMREAALARFQDARRSDAYGMEAPVQVKVVDCDLRTSLPANTNALTLSILTLMFIPVEYRPQLLARLYAQTQAGGALIVVEKVVGQSEDVAQLFTQTYHAFKRQQGYTREEIVRKAMALEGVLVPLTAAWNERLLRQAGFLEVECFWRWCNFAGFLAIK
jgi:tRNA (cmo5U34)-methyltransferase